MREKQESQYKSLPAFAKRDPNSIMAGAEDWQKTSLYDYGTADKSKEVNSAPAARLTAAQIPLKSAESAKIEELLSSTSQLFQNLNYQKEISTARNDMLLFSYLLTKEPSEKNNEIFKSMFRADYKTISQDMFRSAFERSYTIQDYERVTGLSRPIRSHLFAKSDSTRRSLDIQVSHHNSQMSMLNTIRERLTAICSDQCHLDKVAADDDES